MNRLTERTSNGFVPQYARKMKTTNCYDLVSKLGQLEDIEEKYGISILTIFEILTNGCYFRYSGMVVHFVPNEREYACLNLSNKSIDLMYIGPYKGSCRVEVSLAFVRYGVTWALTNEELLCAKN